MLEINGLELWTTRDVVQRIKVHRRTLDRWIREGRFPRPRYHGRRRCWPPAEVDGWVRRRFGPDEPRER